MNKKEFLSRLNHLLSDLAAGEREEALAYYEEYFADAGAENEAEVIAALGSPEQVAKQIKDGLGKTEKGMFTETGYREYVESGNVPEVYGKAGQGNNTWNGNPNRQGNGEQNENPNRWGNGGQNRNPNWQGNGGQNGNPNWQQNTGKAKKKSMSGGKIALIVILCILAFPVLIALAGGLFGVAVGVLGIVFGVALAVVIVVACFLLIGVILFAAGIGKLALMPFTGLVLMGVGCLMIAAFFLMLALLIVIFGKFFPWLIREVESFGKYLKGKWRAHKKGGEEA